MSVDAVGGKREATKAANRLAILDAGRQVFGEMGFGAASVRDIIRGTNLAAGTFYNYFPDKESVFRALVEEVGGEARKRVRAARLQAAGPREFVEGGFRAYFEFIVEDPDNFAFLARNTGTIRALFDDAVVPMGVDELLEDLRNAIALGYLPGHIDIEYIAHTMISVGLELGARLMERDPPDVDGATIFAAELFMGGLERMAARTSG